MDQQAITPEQQMAFINTFSGCMVTFNQEMHNYMVAYLQMVANCGDPTVKERFNPFALGKEHFLYQMNRFWEDHSLMESGMNKFYHILHSPRKPDADDDNAEYESCSM